MHAAIQERKELADTFGTYAQLDLDNAMHAYSRQQTNVQCASRIGISIQAYVYSSRNAITRCTSDLLRSIATRKADSIYLG